jgi:outer membrane protein assembly factor BamA
MWLYKIEYRIPFAKGKGVTGLVFFDAGNAFGNPLVEDDSWKKGQGVCRVWHKVVFANGANEA